VAGQEPAPDDASEGTLASDFAEARPDDGLSLSPPDSDMSAPGAPPEAAEPGPSYGEPLVTEASDSAGPSSLAGDRHQGNDSQAGLTSAEPDPTFEPGPTIPDDVRTEAAPSAVGPSASTYEYSSPPPVEPPARRSGAGSLLLGGALAAALGFGAAYLAQDQFGGSTASAPADLEERLAALESQPVPDTAGAEELAARLADLETRVASLEAAPEPGPAAEAMDLGPLREQVEQGASETQSQIAALEQRLTTLEDRPVSAIEAAPLGSLAADPGPAVQAAPPGETPAGEILAAVEPRLAQFESGLSSIQGDLASNQEAVEEVRTGLNGLETRVGQVETSVGALDTRLGEAETASAAAAEQARAAAAALAETEARSAAAETQARTGAALAQLDAALDGGDPFEEPLSDLQTIGVEVPEALSTAAATGVPSLAALREAFPEAARAALAEARAQGVLDEGGGLTGFLSSQLSLRSTTPREGSDVDAVLSRAESSLARGRLDEALTEVGALPQPVQDAMGDWIAQARTRAGAEAALAALRPPEPDPAPAD
jgi:uncharacterized coiled-coil protein SlyX